MKKSILAVFALCSLFTAADAKMKKQVKNNEIVALEISHGACFGKCPIHTIKIYNTGLVRYSGVSFVQYKGIYEKKLNKTEMQKLLKEAEEYRIDTCGAQYPYVPDMPGIDYTITYKGKTQKIHNAHRGPGFLRELSDDIESAVKVDNTWKKISANATEPRNP